MIPIYGDMSLLLGGTSKGIVSSQITIRELLDAYSIDHSINRDINYGRLPDLVKYLDSYDQFPGIFLPAFVFSYRGNPNLRHDPDSGVFWVEDKALVTIDGQHRIKAIERYVERQTDSQTFLENTVTIQVYFGLSYTEEKQLFVDINSNAKRVSRSLVMKYDSREVANLLVQELYNSSSALKVAGIELDKSKVQRPGNTAFATGQRLKTFISYLLFGKKSMSKSDERLLADNYDQIVSFLSSFFDELFRSLPDIPGDVRKYVLGHEPIQSAIALYCRDCFITFDIHGLQVTGVWEDFVADLSSIDWSVNNIEWRRLGITKTTNQGQYLGFVEGETGQIYKQIQNFVSA